MLGALAVHALHCGGNEGFTAKAGLPPAREPRMRCGVTSGAPSRCSGRGPSARPRSRARARAVFPRLGLVDLLEVQTHAPTPVNSSSSLPKIRVDLLEVKTHAPTPVNSSSSIPKNQARSVGRPAGPPPQLGGDRTPSTRDLGGKDTQTPTTHHQNLEYPCELPTSSCLDLVLSSHGSS